MECNAVCWNMQYFPAKRSAVLRTGLFFKGLYGTSTFSTRGTKLITYSTGSLVRIYFTQVKNIYVTKISYVIPAPFWNNYLGRSEFFFDQPCNLNEFSKSAKDGESSPPCSQAYLKTISNFKTSMFAYELTLNGLFTKKMFCVSDELCTYKTTTYSIAHFSAIAYFLQ